MKDWILKTFLMSWLKGKLDKLPLNGLKMALGVVLLLLAELLKSLDPSQASYSIVKLLIEVVSYLGPDNITDAGLVAIVVGALHKILKYFDGKSEA